jgi:hypothetical protein
MRSLRPLPLRAAAIAVVALAPLATGCDSPHTFVVLDNDYTPPAEQAIVVYDAYWEAVEFQSPVLPGASSEPVPTVAASADTAYVALAPGWDPTSATPPTSFVLLQSRQGFAVHFDDTLHIPVDDATFMGNCAAGSHLTQDQADFLAQRVFRSELGSLGYDATTCKVTGGP